MTVHPLVDSLDSEELLRSILIREGIKDTEVLENTPRRWVQALRGQLGADREEFDFTTFESKVDDMVIVQDIQFSSLCAHHLLPFFGYAHVAYIPQGRIAGLSKLARTVRTWCFGLWTQEELTEAIANNLVENLSVPKEVNQIVKPKGVAVVMQAEHTCMSVRGVRAPGAKTTTSSMRGVFLDNNNNARAEFLSLIRGGK